MELKPAKFSGYQRLHIAKLFERRYRRIGGKKVLEREGKPFFEAISSLLGRCGHKHRSEASARPCLTAMQSKMKRRRRKSGTRFVR